MTTITATPNASTGAVDILISQTSVVTQVLRSNAYGVQQLRSMTGQFPTAASGTTVLTDYENSNGVNTYIAYCDDQTVRTNLCPNPSFETGLSSWTNEINSTSVQSSGAAYSGTHSAKVTKNVATTSSTGFKFSVATTVGQAYTLSAWVMSASGNPQLAWTNQNVASPSVTANGTWQRTTFSFNAVATTTNLFLVFQNVGAVGDAYYIDAVLLEASSTLGGYFDGSTTGDSDNVYAWTGTANASTSTYTHHTRNVSTTATVALDAPWLLCPIAPNYSEEATSVTAFNSARSTNSTVHQIIGRADPIVVMGKLGTRTGKLEVFTSSVSDAERLSRVFSRGETVLLKQPIDQLDMYFTALNVAVDPYAVDAPDTTMFKLTLDFTEVTRPYGDLAGALGWNYDALSSAYANYDAVTANFATYDDLTLDSSV